MGVSACSYSFNASCLEHSLTLFAFFKDEGPLPKDREKYTGPQLLRIFTATCVPDHSSFGGSNHMLECACWKVRVCVVVLSYVIVCSIFQYEVLATWISI